MENQDYGKHFSESRLFTLLRGSAKKVKFLKDALAMFYCLQDSQTPVFVKSMIVAALGYFILPLDAVPDIVPLLGWADDAGVIAATLAGIRMYVKPEHYRRASELLGNPGAGVVE